MSEWNYRGGITNEWNYRGGITAILRDFASELPLRWNRVGGITETIFLSAYVIPPRVRLCDSTQVLVSEWNYCGGITCQIKFWQ